MRVCMYIYIYAKQTSLCITPPQDMNTVQVPSNSATDIVFHVLYTFMDNFTLYSTLPYHSFTYTTLPHSVSAEHEGRRWTNSI